METLPIMTFEGDKAGATENLPGMEAIMERRSEDRRRPGRLYVVSEDDMKEEEHRISPGFDVSARDFYQVKENTAVIRNSLKGIHETLGIQNKLMTNLVDRIGALEVAHAQHVASPGHAQTVAEVHALREALGGIQTEIGGIRQYIAKAAGAVAAVAAIAMAAMKYLP